VDGETAIDMRSESGTPTMQARARWTPAEYLLRGRFCSLATLQERLQELRVGLGARAGLLLVADERAVLRTLCYLATDGPQTRRLTAALQDALAGQQEGLQDMVRQPGPTGGRKSARFPLSAERIVTLLRARFADRPAAQEWFADPHRWVALRPAPVLSGSRIASAVLLDCPRADAQREEGEVTVAVDDRANIEIAEMVNCTVQADVRRDAITSAMLDRTVDWSGVTLDATGFATAAQQFVELAVEVVASQIGALYMTSPDDELELVAVASMPGTANITVPQRVEDLASSAALSLRRHSAVQHPSAPVGESITVTFRGAHEAGENWVELASPVLGPSANLHMPPVGVLVVARRLLDEHSPSYSAYDYSVLRNVAMRLTMLRSATDMEELARTYTRLSEAHVDAVGPRGSEPLEQPDSHAEVIPSDLRIALPAIRRGLAHLARATGSHSATFRVALPDPANAEHGLCLVRVAAQPGRPEREPVPRQAQHEGGINWRAVLSGRAEYAPRVTEDPDYLPAREGTRSELTLPVIVEDRVIGVVNLESREENAYSAREQTARLVVEPIAAAVSRSRVELSRTLQALAIEVATRRHDFAADAKRLSELAGRVRRETVRADLEQLSKVIDDRARRLRSTESEMLPAPGTFPDLFALALARTRLRLDRTEIADCVWPTHTGDTGAQILECLCHVLTNVTEHQAPDGAGRPIARLSQIHWGGRPHDILHIEHRVAQERVPEPHTAVDVYRVPLETARDRDGSPGSGRVLPRFGAYLAGLHARRLGGDAWLTPLDHTRVRVTVAVPRAELPETAG